MKIKFLPQNIEVEGSSDKSLLQIATENHLEIRSICKGVPSCAECRIKIKEGDNNILPPNKAELSLIGTSYFIDGRRLSCQVHCFGDVTVDLTEQVERQENQTKKIRGFRSNKPMESKAVNDMMLLDEKEEVKDAAKDSGEQKEAPAREPREQRPPRENKPQQQQQRPQQQNQNRSQNQNQNKGGGQQQNPNKGQQQRPQQGQGKPQNQQQGKGPQQGNKPQQNAKPQQGQQQQRNPNQQNQKPNPNHGQNQNQNRGPQQKADGGQQNSEKPKK